MVILNVLLADIYDSRELTLPLALEPQEVSTLIAVEGQVPPPICSPLTGYLRLTECGGQLQIVGSFEVKVGAECDRCLASFTAELTINVNEALRLDGPEAITEDDAGDGLVVTDGQVELSPLMAELFWLAWPFRHLCRVDCAGLCLHCGQDQNLGSCSCSCSKLA